MKNREEEILKVAKEINSLSWKKEDPVTREEIFEDYSFEECNFKKKYIQSMVICLQDDHGMHMVCKNCHLIISDNYGVGIDGMCAKCWKEDQENWKKSYKEFKKQNEQ